jgi:ADP-ribosylation factor protein 1
MVKKYTSHCSSISIVLTNPNTRFTTVELTQYKGFSLLYWDVGGRDKLRALWRHYYQNTKFIIFVVDSIDRDRMPEATDEFKRLINEDELRNVHILIFANKQVRKVVSFPFSVVTR